MAGRMELLPVEMSVAIKAVRAYSNKAVNLTPSPLLAAKVRFAGFACYAAGYESRYMLHAVHDPAQV